MKRLPEAFVAGLRPSLGIVARLVNCGLNRKEILYLLAIADTAFRQRLTALRREWKVYARVAENVPDDVEDPDELLARGVLRQSLIAAFGKSAYGGRYASTRMVGSHDPDGHLLVIRSFSAHKMVPRGNKIGKKGE